MAPGLAAALCGSIGEGRESGRGCENTVLRKTGSRLFAFTVRECMAVCNTIVPLCRERDHFEKEVVQPEVPLIWQLKNQVRVLSDQCCVIILCPSPYIITDCKVYKQPGMRQVQPTRLRMANPLDFRSGSRSLRSGRHWAGLWRPFCLQELPGAKGDARASPARLNAVGTVGFGGAGGPGHLADTVLGRWEQH